MTCPNLNKLFVLNELRLWFVAVVDGGRWSLVVGEKIQDSFVDWELWMEVDADVE